MKKNFIKNIFLASAFFIAAIGFSQVYPVQVSPIFNTPYTGKISDYATSLDQKFKLLINPTDISINNRQVRLKIFIQGNGINAQSTDFIQNAVPIFINGGELLSLTNVDLAAYFQLQNLGGLSAEQYTNQLPEGVYNFCFEIHDFATNLLLSQKSCSNIYLMLNDPPILNIPTQNEQIAVTNFPNILFTWTPRQINATNVSYQFELKELIDPTIDPQFGFEMAPIFHQEELFATAMLYDASKPNLVQGRRYAWRVKAISTSGLSVNNVFKNNGNSEIFSFKYDATCLAPTFLLAETQSSSRVKLTWQGTEQHLKYHVQYKKKGVVGAEWFSTYTVNTQTLITDLESNVVYEFRVGASCDAISAINQSYVYSSINEFTLPANATPNAGAYNCGLNPSITIANQTPLTNLIVTETFTAGDFPVKVLEVVKNGSTYTGKGYVTVPYLSDTRIAVVFENITINTNFQLTDGTVETTYDPSWGNVTDLDDLFDPLISEIFGSQTTDSNSNNTSSNQENNSNNSDNTTTENTNTNSGNNTNNNSQTNDPSDPNTNTNTNSNTNSPIVTTNNNNNNNNNNNTGNNTSNNSNGTNVTGTDYYIEYKGGKYFTGGKIKIPYKRYMFETFEMKSLEAGTKVNFTIHEPGKQDMWRGYDANSAKQTIPINELTGSLINLYKQDLHASAFELSNEPKVVVEVEKIVTPFNQNGLTATDLGNTSRVAKAGETLYYINKPTLSTERNNTEFKAILSQSDNNKIPPEYLTWKIDGRADDYKNGVSKFNVLISENKINTTISNKAGFPDMTNKEVKVKWVDEKKQFISFASKISGLLKILEIINSVSEKVEKIAPCKATFLKDFNNSLVWKKENFNQEDNKSRHILDIKRFDFQLKASDLALLECSKKMGVSAFGYDINLGEIYVKLGVGLEVVIRNDKIYYLENQRFLKDKNTSSGGFTIKGELGLRGNIGTEEDENGTQWGIKYGANTSITGGGKIEYPLGGDNNVMGAFLYINPLMYTLKASVKIGPLDKEFEFSDILWNLKLEKVISINLD